MNNIYHKIITGGFALVLAGAVAFTAAPMDAQASAAPVSYTHLDVYKRQLYMGIAHDTGVFQYSCTSPDTMRVAAMLMEKGVPHTYILEETYYKKTYRQNQVMGKALLESMRLMDGKIDRKSTRLNSSHITRSRMPSSA